MTEYSRTRKPRGIPSYHKLYEELVDALTNQNGWFILVGFFLGNAALSFSLLFLNQAIQSENLINNFKLLLDDLVFLLFGALVYGVSFGVLVGVITGLRDTNKNLHRLVARILISTPKPYKNGFGLSSDEIGNLAAMAKIDQDSSDWRGTFLTIVVWGVILGVLSKVSDYLTIPPIPFAPGVTANNPVLVSVSFGVIMVTLVILALLFSWHIANYVGKYLGREPANRAVLNACQEAIAILQSHKLSQKEKLTIKQKKDLAVKLNCAIENGNTIIRPGKNAFLFFDDKGKGYFLLVNLPKKRRVTEELEAEDEQKET